MSDDEPEPEPETTLAELPSGDGDAELALRYDESGLKLHDRFKGSAVRLGRMGHTMLALSESAIKDEYGVKNPRGVFTGDGKRARAILDFAKQGSAMVDKALEMAVKAEQLETRGVIGESADPILPAEAEPDERELRIDAARAKKAASGG